MEEKKSKSAKAQEIERLTEELEKANQLAEENKNKWMRSVAEFDNYKKRNAKIWQEAFNEGASSVVLKILPVGDNLDWALSIGLDEKRV